MNRSIGNHQVWMVLFGGVKKAHAENPKHAPIGFGVFLVVRRGDDFDLGTLDEFGVGCLDFVCVHHHHGFFQMDSIGVWQVTWARGNDIV